MFTAISTTEYSKTPSPIVPVATTACALAIFLSITPNGCGDSSFPVHTPDVNYPALFSTDTAHRTDYHNGDISFLWEGVAVMSPEKSQNLLRILEIERLDDNWNGNGASRFSESILSAAKKLVMSLPIQPAIFPTARDSIQFEYENDAGDYLEFELFESGQLKVFSLKHTGEAVTKNITIPESHGVISEFYGRNI